MESSLVSSEGNRRELSLVPPLAAAAALRNDFDQFDAVTAFYPVGTTFRLDGVAARRTVIAADDRFFDVFALDFLAGEREKALDDPASIVLSASEAERLFGRTDVIGETITKIEAGGDRDYRVTGVFADIPANSHLDVHMVRLIDPAVFQETPDPLSDWGSYFGYVTVKLAPGVVISTVNEAMAAFRERHIPKADGGSYDYAASADFQFVPVTDVHLRHSHDGAMKAGGDIATVHSLAIIMALILVMACINFVNLSTAQAARRSREVAVRRVFGAMTGTIIARFLGEVLLIVASASLLALAAASLAMQGFIDQAFLLPGGDGADSANMALILAALILAVTLGAGLYPALVLRRFKPVEVLRSNSTAETRGSGLMRKALVVGQFSVSIGLIICTAVIYFQTDFARTVDPGYTREDLLVIENAGRPPLAGPRLASFRQQLESLETVVFVAAASLLPASPNESNTLIRRPGGESDQIGWAAVAPGFFETLEMPLISGRYLSPGRAMDDASLGEGGLDSEQALLERGVNVIANEAAIRYLGFPDPASSISEQVNVGLVQLDLGLVPATIVGVVGDARFRSARDPIRPMIYFQDRAAYRYLFLRHDPGSGSQTLESIRAAWIQQFPDIPFSVRVVEQDLSLLYEEEASRSRALAAFSGLAVLIACFGLYGLAAFSAEARTREVGIRKVLGADRRAIVQLLVWQFLSPVLLANLIAWPVAWWLMQDWLSGFESRVALDPIWFLGAGILAFAIAAVTISSLAFKAASEKPVRALRYE